ncbi:MAG: hypothetical protein SV375_09060 [Thermodesulfobacteriota bacterium]|nr:hypothetical protein [Thermodesulfobacteriota bacterium]
MKITNSEVIRSGEQELIDAISGDLDWGIIEEIFRDEHKLGIGEDVEYKRGDIVVHNNQVAYRLEFDVKVTVSVLLDREGNHLSFTSSADLLEDEEVLEVSSESEPSDHLESLNLIPATPSPEGSQERIFQAASLAGDMIGEMDEQ